MLLRESRPPFMTSHMTSHFLSDETLNEEPHSYNDVLKNNPILSEILQQPSDETSPDSGCWGSVNFSRSSFENEPSSCVSRFVVTSQTQITEPRLSTNSSYVPLYLRRAGMKTSSDDESTNSAHENRLKPDIDDPFQNFGRFTQEPVLSSNYSHQIPMFERKTPSHDPFSGSTGSSVSNNPVNPINKPVLTYANVLRNPQLLRENNDPLTRIRNLVNILKPTPILYLNTVGTRILDNRGLVFKCHSNSGHFTLHYLDLKRQNYCKYYFTGYCCVLSK